MEMRRLTRDGTAEPVSRDQILRHERGQGIIKFPCSADHVHGWQPFPVDPYSCYMCDHIYIHKYIHTSPVLSICPLNTNSGSGKERRILIGPRQHLFGTTLRFTGPVPADSRQ